LALSNDSLKNRIFKSPIENMGIFNDTGNKYIFTPSHDSLIRTAYNMFLDKPIFGHGQKMFRVICKDENYATGVRPCSTHPHNFYIQLLAETGIIGFLFLFLTLIYVVYCAFKQLKSILFKEQRYLTDYQVCLIACLFITVWPLSPNGNFFNNWLAICYSLPVGFFLHSIYGKNKAALLE
jgi:O-antigen ligase